MNETGYHGTCLKHRESIESEGLDPDKTNHRLDHWLGQGIYFFDKYEQALWWANIASSRNDQCGGIIFEAEIEALDEEVLNLDDNEQLDAFISETQRTVNEIRAYCPGKMPIFEQNKFRAFFFDYYKIQNGISVIIGTFYKPYAGYTKIRTPDERDFQKKFLNLIGMNFREKQICVSKKDCIKSTVLIYNEKEEVI